MKYLGPLETKVLGFRYNDQIVILIRQIKRTRRLISISQQSLRNSFHISEEKNSLFKLKQIWKVLLQVLLSLLVSHISSFLIKIQAMIPSQIISEQGLKTKKILGFTKLVIWLLYIVPACFLKGCCQLAINFSPAWVIKDRSSPANCSLTMLPSITGSIVIQTQREISTF